MMEDNVTMALAGASEGEVLAEMFREEGEAPAAPERDIQLITECHTLDLFQIFGILLNIIACQLMESFFAFSYHYTEKRWIFPEKFPRIIGHLRTTCPEIGLRKNFLQVRSQLLYKRNIPDIAGKTDNIRLLQINIFQNLIPDLIDRIFPDHDLGAVFT